MTLKLDSGREMSPRPYSSHPHLDHGYAVTSYSSQGQTADRVLIHVIPTRGKGPAQQPHGLCRGFSRAVGCTDFHQ